MALRIVSGRAKAAAAAGVIVAAALGYWAWRSGHPATPANDASTKTHAAAAPREPNSVDLSATQLNSVKVQPVELREFPVDRDAIGSIDFNEDMTVQVFTPYQGRIIGLFAEVGDNVKKGQTLYTIDSPDLLQAESTLISAAGVLELSNRNLKRLQELYTTRAVSQANVEQAISEQQTAEGNLRAARDAVRIFGKTDADIDKIVAQRIADPTLVVPSPIDGRVTARNAAPGLFVQPGSPPAPYTVANIDTMWMLANVAEDDSPDFRAGQPERVRIAAFPGRVFEAKVTTVGATVDPNTRRVLVRSEIKDPRHELRAGMFASFTIEVGDPERSPAIPINGVVREGDGTMTAWVTADRRHFTQRTIKIGQERDGYWQILDGVKAGELAASEGAIFLSNQLALEQ